VAPDGGGAEVGIASGARPVLGHERCPSRILFELAQEEARDGPQRVVHREASLDDQGLSLHAAGARVEDGEEEIVLAGEVCVHRARRAPGGLGDLCERRAVDPMSEERLACRLDQCCTRLRLAHGASHPDRHRIIGSSG